VSTVENIEGSDEDISNDEEEPSRPLRQGSKRKRQDTSQYLNVPESEDQSAEEDADSEDELQFSGRTRSRKRRATAKPEPSGRSLRARRNVSTEDEDEGVGSDETEVLQSDLYGAPKSKRRQARRSEDVHVNARHSSRTTRHVGGMREVELDDIYRSDSDAPRQPAKPKQVGVREIFQELPRNSEFRMRHRNSCDVCGEGPTFAKLIGCQGCSLTYHKQCLGHRTNREHLVTKVGEEDFVLQCRRCVAFPRKKDPSAPDQGKCQECKQHGGACRPFRPRKTPAQEQRDREENDGVDPIYDVPPERINNVDNVLFRCTNCFRAFHYEHLPSLAEYDTMIDGEADPEQRFREYSREWKCKDCAEMPAKVSGLIAWKPVDEDLYDPALGAQGVEEEDKVYLVRWDGMSYFRARWVPGPWVWGVTAHSMRKAFAKRDDAQHPTMRTEDAIPEDYLRTDIVLDIKFTSIVDIRTEEIDKARIREVHKALIKYKGLTYEDSVWETPPSPEDGERWSDFVMAYNDWVAGRYVRQPKNHTLKSRLEKLRREDFRNLEKIAQPDTLEGGKLMEYQIQGLNWLYYKWFTQSNAILADEMGLGKTIQIIGFLATLVQEHGCYPFLVVVPNSTCPNWRREIKRWAPSLRVVAYYGSRESREMAYKYELYPEHAKDLRCHIVVTSYDAAADDSCRKFFRGVQWQGLIVDEGQRLKNDKNQLYSALRAMKAPFKILLTGTPLQNNQRELFNLLHFLDEDFDPLALEQEFFELDQTKIERLHDLIRPFFLRRTKAQVLTFLPPMAQIIVPVSMSIVQKKLYRSILAKNPDLMKAIFSADAKTAERANLSNILMQLRKCLCHPFVYNKSIEDRGVDTAASHRNLVDASSKLQLLELLLPKLQERGHRVLIFSQFLDMLDMVEDFMDGMQLRYQRLDGTVSSLNKQKRIDEFNAPDSSLFAFLLSTRAGGVGINLASADTVIILDPDFNPHQDIQALSRAHRIGQRKKVLCFQLVTRASAEERIMQIGRRKLALDHVLIQEMDADDEEQVDLVSVLRHGASELFEDNADQDIHYDSLNVERLLDRSHMENTGSGEDKTAETQFSFARVWANDKAALQDANLDTAESAPDPGVWANILKERERIAAEEAAAKAEAFGRGRRARVNIDYTGEAAEAELANVTPIKGRKKRENGDDSDTDFQADESEHELEEERDENLEHAELVDLVPRKSQDGEGNYKGKNPPNIVLPKPAASPSNLNRKAMQKVQKTRQKKEKAPKSAKVSKGPSKAVQSMDMPGGKPGRKLLFIPKQKPAKPAKPSKKTTGEPARTQKRKNGKSGAVAPHSSIPQNSSTNPIVIDLGDEDVA
jgi:superfamily II DNA or RNA helicase